MSGVIGRAWLRLSFGKTVMITIRSFLVLGLSLVIGLGVFGAQIGRAVKMGREFDRYLAVKGLSEREVKATLVIWPIRFSVAAEDLGALKTAMETNRGRVLSFLQESGIDSKEITQGLPVVSDREDERIQANRPSLARYRGVVTLVVRSSNVDMVKKAIQGADALLEKGVTLAGNESGDRIEFIFNAVNEIKPDMIREATANARRMWLTGLGGSSGRLSLAIRRLSARALPRAGDPGDLARGGKSDTLWI
ncbi:MAG: SIMPL domain-containing protein [Limisphaerales bacterium]